MILKRESSIYRPGLRGADWIKVPIRHREEFVVGGYLPSARGYSTLILGQFDRRENYVYAGFCVNGLSEDTRAVILEKLRTSHRRTCPFRTLPDLRDDFRELPDVPLAGSDRALLSKWSIASG